eukprot:51247_1
MSNTEEENGTPTAILHSISGITQSPLYSFSGITQSNTNNQITISQNSDTANTLEQHRSEENDALPTILSSISGDQKESQSGDKTLEQHRSEENDALPSINNQKESQSSGQSLHSIISYESNRLDSFSESSHNYDDDDCIVNDDDCIVNDADWCHYKGLIYGPNYLVDLQQTGIYLHLKQLRQLVSLPFKLRCMDHCGRFYLLELLSLDNFDDLFWVINEIKNCLFVCFESDHDWPELSIKLEELLTNNNTECCNPNQKAFEDQISELQQYILTISKENPSRILEFDHYKSFFNDQDEWSPTLEYENDRKIGVFVRQLNLKALDKISYSKVCVHPVARCHLLQLLDMKNPDIKWVVQEISVYFDRNHDWPELVNTLDNLLVQYYKYKESDPQKQAIYQSIVDLDQYINLPLFQSSKGGIVDLTRENESTHGGIIDITNEMETINSQEWQQYVERRNNKLASEWQQYVDRISKNESTHGGIIDITNEMETINSQEWQQYVERRNNKLASEWQQYVDRISKNETLFSSHHYKSFTSHHYKWSPTLEYKNDTKISFLARQLNLKALNKMPYREVCVHPVARYHLLELLNPDNKDRKWLWQEIKQYFDRDHRWDQLWAIINELIEKYWLSKDCDFIDDLHQLEQYISPLIKLPPSRSNQDELTDSTDELSQYAFEMDSTDDNNSSKVQPKSFCQFNNKKRRRNHVNPYQRRNRTRNPTFLRYMANLSAQSKMMHEPPLEKTKN